MATSITLSYGASILTLRPADFADQRTVERVQVRGRTHDGLLIVGDKALTIVQFILSWNALTHAEQQNIEAFFGPLLVNGSLNTFTYLDHFSVENTVRLLTPVVSYSNEFTDFWRVSMEFEVVVEATGS